MFKSRPTAFNSETSSSATAEIHNTDNTKPTSTSTYVSWSFIHTYDHVEALGRFFEAGAEDVSDEEDDGDDQEESPHGELVTDRAWQINYTLQTYSTHTVGEDGEQEGSEEGRGQKPVLVPLLVLHQRSGHVT